MQGWQVRKGEKGTSVEYWKFDEERETTREDGSVKKERVKLERPHVFYATVFHASQIDGMPQQSKMFGFPNVQSFEPTRWLKDGYKVHFGEIELDVLHCPGHTPGHVIFYHQPSHLAQVGDVLFQGSIGRTDFPKGDHATLVRSIKEKLFPLGDEVDFIPGHGPMSTFGEERKHNPFLSGRFG